jgi:hypothetical protein
MAQGTEARQNLAFLRFRARWADDRVMSLQMISMAFQMAYGQKEAIKITKEAAN